MTEEEKKKAEADAAAKKASDDAAAATQKAVDEATAKFKKDLEDKEAELKKLKDKDHNFGKVIKTAEEKEKQLEEATKEIADLKNKIVEVAAAPINEAKTNLLDALSKGDKVLRDKLELKFNLLGKDVKTVSEVENTMREAYMLATGAPPQAHDALKNFQGNGGRGNFRPALVNSGNIPNEVKEWRDEFNKHLPKELQITDEDLKKYPVKSSQSRESTY